MTDRLFNVYKSNRKGILQFVGTMSFDAENTLTADLYPPNLQAFVIRLMNKESSTSPKDFLVKLDKKLNLLIWEVDERGKEFMALVNPEGEQEIVYREESAE